MTTTKQDLPHPINEGQTHYEGCWQDRGHHNCAVEEIRRLLKGEFICTKCGIRKDSEHPKGDF